MARVQELVGTLPAIVGEMRSLISSRQTAEEVPANWGWRIGGPRFMDEMTKLKMELKAQGKPVTTCKAFHVFKESKVKNPTGRMIVIPIGGTIMFKKGGQVLSPGHYYYIEDERILHGQDMDVILVSLEEKKAAVSK
ncbi:hypothetical protein BJY01DRAFT_249735 [Aspergillus pseudoustus]|uniref:Uncharacterized protein n=1 Tax=Aspergillus pseudoustus TaxID=1810923 RepID=A0ABR4JLV5_9EURO